MKTRTLLEECLQAQHLQATHDTCLVFKKIGGSNAMTDNTRYAGQGQKKVDSG